MRPPRLLLAAALAAAACADQFPPGSYLNDLRILALVTRVPGTDPGRTEVGPGDALAVDATTYAPPGEDVVSQVWSFCPLTQGAPTGYACVDPRCEVPLAGAGASVTLTSPGTPYELALACLAAVGGGAAAPPGTAVPEQVEAVVRYTVTSRSSATGATNVREAVQRVPLWTVAPPAPNVNPAFVVVTVGGAPVPDVEIGGTPVAPGGGAVSVPPGGKLPIVVRTEPGQAYLDASGRTLTESIVVFFYSTAGRFDSERASGPEAAVQFEATDLEPGQAGADVWVVVRDLRGGQAIAGPYRISIP